MNMHINKFTLLAYIHAYARCVIQICHSESDYQLNVVMPISSMH